MRRSPILSDPPPTIEPVPPRSKAPAEYTARSLSVLEGLEAVRKRPGMYIGSTDSRGLMHCAWEIIDNAVDEALEGHGKRIEVILHPDSSVEVRDQARGVPVDVVAGTGGKTGVEVVYTKLHAGGKFGGGSYAASGGLHGVGASVVNALSERFQVEVDRGGKTYRMQFQRGVPGTFADEGEPRPDAPFTRSGRKATLEVVGTVKRGVTGTRVRYWVDPQIFPSSSTFQGDDLIARARQTAFLVPGLTIAVEDLRGEEPITEEFCYAGGVVDFVDHLAPDGPVTDPWQITGSGTFTETVQQLDSKGHLKPKEVERTCEVDIALRWGNGFDTVQRSFVNIIATPKGGSHVAGFEAAVVKVFRRLIEGNPRKYKLTAKDGKLEKDDVLAGMTAVVTVRVPEPQFEGQTKEVLGTAPVRGIVARIVEQQLEAILTSGKRQYKAQAALVLEKVVGEMRTRVSARLHKEIARRKNALETSALPAKLSDCRTDEVERSELFIVEGLSALGTAKEARNSEFQAILPIRGKILNVQKVSPADVLRNAECAAIIQVIGAGSGRTFELDQARYGKVILMTDADVDGAHIRTLLLTFFFKYMRELVEEGRVFAAVPPLHRIEVSGAGRRAPEIIYTYTEQEMHTVLSRLERQGRKYKDPIQRYKGLGEMDANQLAETTMDPAKRTLRRITVADMEEMEKAQKVFELLMGSEVAPRKEFIVAGAQRVERDNIDA